VSVSLTLLNVLQYAVIIVIKKLRWDCKVMYYIQIYAFALCDIICQVVYTYDKTGLSWSCTIMDFTLMKRYA